MAIIKQKEQRVAMLIDTQNLYHSARNLYGAKVNFGAILKEAVSGRHLVRAIAYVITTEAEDEKSFFEALNSLGIETKTKDIQIFFGGAKKADWDVGLAVDAVRLAPKVDAIILASGDNLVYKDIALSIASAVRSFNGNVTIIASSDMTHYESQKSANEKDKAAIEAILNLDTMQMLDRIEKLGISMCGYMPVTIALMAAKLLGAKTGKLIAYETSGDVTGDYSSVVGYAGIIIQ